MLKTAGVLNNLLVLENNGTTSLGLTNLAYSPGPNEAYQSLTYTITALPNPAMGSIVLADGTTPVTVNTSYSLAQIQGLEFETAPNGYGQSVFSFAVQDNGGTANGGQDTLNQSLNISVQQVPSPPPNQPANAIVGSNQPIVGTGNQRIEGGIGAKTITGGGGNNVFVYSSMLEIGQTITNFTVGQDKIDLSGLLNSLVPGGYQGTNAITDGYIKLVQGSTSDTTILDIDRDGPLGPSIFRPFLQLENVTPTQLSNPSNFIF